MDVRANIGLYVWIAYIALIALSLFSKKRNFPIIQAGLATGMILMDFWNSKIETCPAFQPGQMEGNVGVNRRTRTARHTS